MNVAEALGAKAAPEAVREVRHTGCVVVGGGPAGVMLAYLLARQAVPVTLLEAHADFDRDFRGDTIHPSTLEVLDELGLAHRLLQLPHGTMRRLQIVTPAGITTMADLSHLRTRFPYVMMLSQARFLDFLAEEGQRFPDFHRVMGANVQRLVQEDGVIRGVRYRSAEGAWHEVRAPLTVGADGRFSKVRSLAGLTPVKTAPPIDVVWFRLPRRPSDPQDTGTLHAGGGHFLVLLDRADDWQVGFVILKGGYAQLRAAGLDALRQSVARLVPWLLDRVGELQDWHQMPVLSVESSRVSRWYRPGLLLIGDAAHVMSPVGGVGINYAIQDAVETANLLGEPLRAGRVDLRHLAAVQRRRELRGRFMQTLQGFLQQRLAAQALRGDRPFRLPLLLRVLLRLPLLRDLPARMIAFGIRRVHVAR